MLIWSDAKHAYVDVPDDSQGNVTTRPKIGDDRRRAIAVARVILRAPNIDKDSDTACLARMFLREAGLSLDG